LNGVLRTTTAGGKFLTNMTPNVQTHFSSLVRVGTLGSGTEQPLESATRALTSPNIAGANEVQAIGRRPDRRRGLIGAIVIAIHGQRRMADDLSDLAAFVNGHTVVVDGGSTDRQGILRYRQGSRPTGAACPVHGKAAPRPWRQGASGGGGKDDGAA
jgi:hypothetical protein